MSSSRGPVPKRSDQRRRRNKPGTDIDRAPGAGDFEIPEVDPEWHAIARRWYESLIDSGQSVYYEPSDWATAYLIAESISRDLDPQFVGINEVTGEVITRAIPLKGASLAAYLKAMTALVVTEGDRRRAGVELQRAGANVDEDEEAADATVVDLHSRFTG